MKYWLSCVGICIFLISCSKDCNHDVAEQRELWLSSEPDAYAYTVRRSLYTSQEYLGPYRLHVIDGVTDTIYFDLESFPVDTAFLFDGWDDYDKVKEYAIGFDLESVFATVENHNGDCTVTYDPTYHFPTDFDIPVDPDIADSGYRLLVTNFEEL